MTIDDVLKYLEQATKDDMNRMVRCLNAENKTWGILDLIGWEIREIK